MDRGTAFGLPTTTVETYSTISNQRANKPRATVVNLQLPNETAEQNMIIAKTLNAPINSGVPISIILYDYHKGKRPDSLNGTNTASGGI